MMLDFSPHYRVDAWNGTVQRLDQGADPVYRGECLLEAAAAFDYAKENYENAILFHVPLITDGDAECLMHHGGFPWGWDPEWAKTVRQQLSRRKEAV